MMTPADEIEAELRRTAETVLSRDDVNTVLADLAKRLGLDSLQLDESNVAQLIIDEDVEVTLVHAPHLPGLIATVPIDYGGMQRVRALRLLLQANMSWDLTQGGAFGMVPSVEEPMLSRVIVLTALDAEPVEAALFGLVDLAQAWRRELQSAKASVPAPEPLSPFSPGVGIRV